MSKNWYPNCMSLNSTDKYCLDTNYEDPVTNDELKKNGMLLKHVLNKTPELCLTAVKHNGDAIIYVKNLTEEIMLAAVKQKGIVLKYIKFNNQTDKICMAALHQNPLALKYIKHQTNEMIKTAIMKNPVAVTMINKPSKELYYELVNLNINTFKYLDIKYIDNDFVNIVWEKYVKNDGLELKHCTLQTEKICEIAIDQNPHAIQYINKETFTISIIRHLYEIALMKDPMVIKYIKKPTNKQIKMALEKNGMVIQYIRDPTYDQCKIAIKQNNDAIKEINNNYYRTILYDNAYIKSKNIFEECSICYSDERHFMKFNCNHQFCRDCSIHLDNCPMCRRKLRNFILIEY